jgi:DNA polymerase III sliding clamp (beta) subunit (PCNA family)
MLISKEVLKHALEVVKPGLANKEMIEQSTSFAFMEDRIVTYNDEISISYPLEGFNFHGAIKAEELYQLVSKIKKDEIEIEVTDNELLITAGRTKAALILQQEIKLPLDDIGSQDDWKELPPDFMDALKFTVDSCSNDMSLSILICVNVNNNIVQATDNHRLAYYTLPTPMPVPEFLIPSVSVKELLKMKPIQIAQGNGWIHFKTEDNATVSCRVFQDKFPDTKKVLQTTGISLTLPKTLDEILDRAMIFSKKNVVTDESITIEIFNNRIAIKSKSETGKFEEEANLKYSGEKATFFITPTFLRNIVSKSNSCVINPTRIMFTGENWIYIAMLRIS